MTASSQDVQCKYKYYTIRTQTYNSKIKYSNQNNTPHSGKTVSAGCNIVQTLLPSRQDLFDHTTLITRHSTKIDYIVVYRSN